MLTRRDPARSEIGCGAFFAHTAIKAPDSVDSPLADLESSAKCGRRRLLRRQGGGEVGAGFNPRRQIAVRGGAG